MLSQALLFALYVYALAFAIAIMTAGIIKVIQLATSLGERRANSANQTEGK